MQLSLKHVRIAFVALGALLLGALSLLVRSTGERLERQRALRHQVVAERVLDELERELTAFLASESRRPSAAYDASSDPTEWAPFVVGYFTVADGYHLVSRDLLERERVARIEGALGVLWPAPRVASRAPAVEPKLDAAGAAQTAPLGPAEPVAPATATHSKTTPDVMRALNRGRERRRVIPAPLVVKQNQFREDPY